MTKTFDMENKSSMFTSNNDSVQICNFSNVEADAHCDGESLCSVRHQSMEFEVVAGLSVLGLAMLQLLNPTEVASLSNVPDVDKITQFLLCSGSMGNTSHLRVQFREIQHLRAFSKQVHAKLVGMRSSCLQNICFVAEHLELYNVYDSMHISKLATCRLCAEVLGDMHRTHAESTRRAFHCTYTMSRFGKKTIANLMHASAHCAMNKQTSSVQKLQHAETIEHADVAILPEFAAQSAFSVHALDMLHDHYECIGIRAKTVYVTTK